MSNRIKITPAIVKKSTCELGKTLFIKDSEAKGLNLFLSRRGRSGELSKSLVYQAKHRGKKVFKKLPIAVSDQIKTSDIEKARKIALDGRSRLLAGETFFVESEVTDHTYGDLLLAYVKRLYDLGKPSAKQVESALIKHIRNMHPKLWKKRLTEVTLDDCMEPCSRLWNEEAKYRMSDKLRSYQRAAWRMAVERKASRPTEMSRFGVTNDPTTEWARDKYEKKNKKQAVSPKLMAKLWKASGKLPFPRSEMLRLMLLFSGQRHEQLRRLTWSDIDKSQMLVTIKDSKGVGDTYLHVLPLTEQMLMLILLISSEGYVFSSDGGVTPISQTYWRDTWRLLEGIIPELKDLTPQCIRATVATELSRAGVSPEVRHMLLSSDKHGVEATHYNSHLFIDEKREAMKLWKEVLGA